MTEYLFDARGRKYEVYNTADVDALKEEGGLFSLSRTDVTITVNESFDLTFALHAKAPNWLYINGRPAVSKILYANVKSDNGFWYGFYFDEIEYQISEILGDPTPVRKVRGKVAKCLLVP